MSFSIRDIPCSQTICHLSSYFSNVLTRKRKVCIISLVFIILLYVLFSNWKIFKQEVSVEKVIKKVVKDYSLIIMIPSSTENLNARNDIRKAFEYFRGNGTKFSYFFIIGKHHTPGTLIDENIIKEKENYNDIYLIDSYDRYGMIGTKIVAGLKHINENYNNHLYLMKTDDDVYVALNYLSNYISKYDRNNMSYIGSPMTRSPVIYDSNHKNHEHAEVISGKYFYPYALGSAYLLKTEHLSCMLNKSNFHTVYRNEDAYVGFLAGQCDVKLVKDIRLSFWKFPTSQIDQQKMTCSELQHFTYDVARNNVFTFLKTHELLFQSKNCNWNLTA